MINQEKEEIYSFNRNIDKKKSVINKNKIKKYLSIFVVIFVLVNIWLYNIEYKRYVSQAPSHLQEARKEFVNAIMFHAYYTFLVKTIRIDFQNPILYPLKAPRDYFYHKGLDKLPREDGERAMWFDMFEAKLYNFSCKGVYGGLTKRYGEEFSQKFIDKIYENIRILSLYEISDKKTHDIYEDSLETFIGLVTIFTFDFHVDEEGYLFSRENMKKVSIDSKLHERFKNIYEWQKSFISIYKQEDENQYNKILNHARGWYSPYQRHYDSMYIISSFILFYKVNNEIFDCKKDKKYLATQNEGLSELKDIVKDFSKTSIPYKLISRKTSYLHVKNESVFNEVDKNSTNPLNTTINCN